LERLAFTPSNSQIRSVGADQIEPRLVEKLSKSKRASSLLKNLARAKGR